jgi:integrase
MALTALKVRTAKPGRHGDGRGLYLMVSDSGARSWVARIQMNGVRRDYGLGSAWKVTLAEARLAVLALHRRLARGEVVTRRAFSPPRKVLTFREAAIDCHKAMAPGWRNKRHSKSWLVSLEQHVFERIGSRPVNTIDSVMVRNVLAPIWLEIPETARRILQRIGAVLDYAHIQGWCSEEISLHSVPKGLPRQPRRDNHYAAMAYGDVPAFIKELAALPATPGRDALKFTILNAVRSGETRLAVWPEFDLDSAIWTIPAERMKARREHVVPLSPAVVDILRHRWRFRSSDEGLVFSNDGKRPLSDMTLTKVLRDMGRDKVTVHGFRSAFTDWAAEETDFPKEVVDKALAHQVPDRVEAAYRRTDFFERRRRLMRDWATFLISQCR